MEKKIKYCGGCIYIEDYDISAVDKNGNWENHFDSVQEAKEWIDERNDM